MRRAAPSSLVRRRGAADTAIQMHQPAHPPQGATARCWLGALPPSEVRARFGQRLKELRQLAGFRSARSFALAVALDENRYTRYERGEVEPNLASICRFCSVLGVEPNDLFSFEHAPGAATAPLINGGSKGRLVASQAWRVATAIASLNRGDRDGPGPAGQDDPLRPLHAVAQIYHRLLKQEPGPAIADILTEYGLDALEPGPKAELASLIAALLDGDASGKA